MVTAGGAGPVFTPPQPVAMVAAEGGGEKHHAVRSQNRSLVVVGQGRPRYRATPVSGSSLCGFYAPIRPGPVPGRLCTRPAPPFNSKFSRLNRVLARFGPLFRVKK